MEVLQPNTKVMTFHPRQGRSKTWDVLPGRMTGPDADPEHMDILVAALSEKGPVFWNEWRTVHPSVQPNLANIEFRVGNTQRGPMGVNLSGYDLSGAVMNNCKLAYANLTHTKMCEVKLREALINDGTIYESDFSGSDLTQTSMSVLKCIKTRFAGADLSRALLFNSTVFACNFDGADLEAATLDSALLNGSSFRNAILLQTRLGLSDLTGCVLTGTNLTGAHFIKTKLKGADLTGARVYGTNCWDVEMDDDTIQRDLVVTGPDDPIIRVDDIRVAQFVHLILTNENLKNALETVTRRGVLILGRFGEGGIEVLRAVGQGLREAGYLPIIFEFERPRDRSYTETVRTLAGLARFVVVDLSGPSVPQELYATVPHLKIPFVPILEKGKHAYSMFKDLLEYDWVLKPIFEFESMKQLLLSLQEKVIMPAEKRVESRLATLTELHEEAK